MAWQQRLYAKLVAGSVPDALDIPTGLGKTAVIPLWLMARALNPALPRRLIYVVDRRVVVDQASDVARQVRERLETPELAELKAALGLAASLPVSTLRGGLAGNREWLENPASPAIIVGTVDMIGSRLLFGGYGVSRKMRAVHAALLAVDSLIVLDEAHLVPPFEGLIRTAGEFAGHDAQAASLPALTLRRLSLSATGAPSPDAFKLSPEEKADPPAAARLNAAKHLAVGEPVAAGALAGRLADRASELAGDSEAVTIFCDSRKIAQTVADDLRRRYKGKGEPDRVALLVGERRVHERQALADGDVFRRFQPRGSEAHGKSELTGPAFLVATSAGEVGADLDADHMVCDLVAWERMIQRLGRVNRRAEPAVALVDVIPALSDKEAEQPVDTVERLSILLAPWRAPVWTTVDDGRVQASPGALADVKAALPTEVVDAASTPAPLRPELTRATLEAWSLTSLEPHPGRPVVAPWLRGWVDDDPQTRLLWRAHLPVHFVDVGEPVVVADAQDFFEVAPPHLSEIVEAPAWKVAEVLKARAKAWLKQKPSEGREAEPVLVLLGRDNRIERVVTLERLREQIDGVRDFAGRTVAVDARLGGLDDDGLLDAKSPKDLAPVQALDNGGWDGRALQAAGFRVEFGKPRALDPQDWRTRFRWTPQEDADEPAELRILRYTGDAAEAGDPAVTRWAQRLEDHQRWAGEDAEAIGLGVGLPLEGRQALRIAAELHDEGKVRREWQRATGMAEDGTGPWAKSGRRLPGDRLSPDSKRSDGRAAPALMSGYRHEFGSLRDVLDSDRLPADEGWRDLVLHLIASHHGHARPTIPAYDPDWPPSASHALARDVALRFARLQARWGP
jgi:CRISPR-associated endonuclease/helicase Cas3